MLFLRLDGKETRDSGQIRRWEVVRETEKGILIREKQVLLWNGEIDEVYETEAWLPKQAIHESPGTGFHWIEDWALRGKHIHPLEAKTYETGTQGDELAARQLAAIEAGKGVWK